MGNIFEIVPGPADEEEAPDLQGREAAHLRSPLPTEAKDPEPFDFDSLTPEEQKEHIQRAVAEGRVGYQCAFCDEVITEGVMALLLVHNWDQPEEKQRAVQSFCHPDCMTAALLAVRSSHGLKIQ